MMAALSMFLVDGHPRIVAVVRKQNSMKGPGKQAAGICSSAVVHVHFVTEVMC